MFMFVIPIVGILMLGGLQYIHTYIHTYALNKIVRVGVPRLDPSSIHPSS
jgi:hypothetical protein